MSRHLLVPALVLSAVSMSPSLKAQSICPAGVVSDKLICAIPQAFGPNGLVLPASSAFQNSFANNSLAPLNSAIARQSVLLPLASPSSGITFTEDPVSKLPVPSTDSLGPIFAERADTIGKHQLFVGFDYQYLKFDSLDNFSLKNLPEVFTQADNTLFAPPGQTCSNSPDGINTGKCAYIRDVVKVNNRIDLKIHQFITFITFGITKNIDVSLAVPITDVRLGIVSDATIVDVSTTGVHAFDTQPGCDPTKNCLHKQFPSFRTASGIGDMTIRIKGMAWRSERSAVAIGLDVRAPTGDSLNFLGAGAAGVKPFVVWSRRARFSPHVNAGFEVNGSSRIAGDISTGSKERLPSQFTYTAGTDVWLNKRVTVAFDLVGQEVFQARRLIRKDITELAPCTPNQDNPPDPLNPTCPVGSGPANQGSTDPNLSQTTGTFNVSNFSVGAKLRPSSNLVITANVLVKINDGGLRAKSVPLVAASYTF
jgi:hypothetical protein